MTMMRTNQTRMNLKLTTKMMTTRMNRKLRTKMNRSVRSGPTATLTKNATFPLLVELPDKNASSWKYVDVRSAPTATQTNNATFPLLEVVQDKNARSLKCADVRSGPTDVRSGLNCYTTKKCYTAYVGGYPKEECKYVQECY